MTEGDKVDLIIGKESPLGFSVLINEAEEGLLYRNEIFQELTEGQRIEGFIKKVREDGKVDVALQSQNFKNVISDLETKVVKKLDANDGFLALSDKTSPEIIKDQLQMSKKNFKKAIGTLYKQQRIRIESDGIYLLKK